MWLPRSLDTGGPALDTATYLDTAGGTYLDTVTYLRHGDLPSSR